jgi:hypothetical protein
MPEPGYGVSQTDDAQKSYDAFPETARPELNTILCTFEELRSLHPQRFRSDNKGFDVYTHTWPAIEITFTIDHDRKLIRFLRFDMQQLVPRVMVFVAYARRNEAMLRTIREWLYDLEQNGQLRCWDDRDIEPGSKWPEQIKTAIGHARIAVLLVSQQFLSSQFIRDYEMPWVFARFDRGELKLVWIPISLSKFESTPLGPIQALCCDPNQPLDTLPPAEQGQKLKAISQAIERLVQEVSNARPAIGN